MAKSKEVPPQPEKPKPKDDNMAWLLILGLLYLGSRNGR